MKANHYDSFAESYTADNDSNPQLEGFFVSARQVASSDGMAIH